MAPTKSTRRTAAKSTQPTAPPNRTEPHRIDTQAVRLVQSKLTADWLTRSVEDRDYGADMMLEAFDGNKPTGILVLLQIKGHAASFGSNLSMAVPVKTLLYARMFQTPFFLVTVSLEDNAAYFVWLQKYINVRLRSENKRWDRQEHVTIHFPKDNILNAEGLTKIRSLVTYTAHRDAGITFLANLVWLAKIVRELESGAGKPALEQALLRLKEIERLEEFLSAYEEHVDYPDLERFRKVLTKAMSYGSYDYGDDDFVDSEMTKLHQIQLMFLSQDDVDEFVVGNSEEDLPY